MPELPEVESARRVLSSALEGTHVVAVQTDDALVVRGGARGLDGLVGGRFLRVERRGKRLRLVFEVKGREISAFSHLGMTGLWVKAEAGEEPVRFERVRIDVAKAKPGKPGKPGGTGKGRGAVVYADARRLGRIVVAEEYAGWKALGPDPLTDGIDVKRFFEALHTKRRTVKEALLDQRLLAGVGNIHAIESLWRAKIDPRSRTDKLTLADVNVLAKAIKASIAFGLKHQETEDPRYVNQGGSNPYRIYGRKGPCPRCGHPLAKMVLGGRGTVLCSGCQRLVR
jgi:formamidopyrimidine-DNA glycosylase